MDELVYRLENFSYICCLPKQPSQDGYDLKVMYDSRNYILFWFTPDIKAIRYCDGEAIACEQLDRFDIEMIIEYCLSNMPMIWN